MRILIEKIQQIGYTFVAYGRDLNVASDNNSVLILSTVWRGNTPGKFYTTTDFCLELAHPSVDRTSYEDEDGYVRDWLIHMGRYEGKDYVYEFGSTRLSLRDVIEKHSDCVTYANPTVEYESHKHMSIQDKLLS